jgi:predicted Zn-dependent protease
MGHVLGLVHCRAPGCLMNFAQGLGKLDRLDLALCTACQSRLVRFRLRLPGGASRPPREPEPEKA